MSSHEAKIAKLEEAMDSVKRDTHYIRDKLDQLSWKVLSVSGAVSVIASIVTALVVKAMSGSGGAFQ